MYDVCGYVFRSSFNALLAQKQKIMAKSPAEFALGPIFIGVVFNIALHGVMTTQVYLYSNNCKMDRMWLKCLVVFLFLADTVNAVLDIIYVYDALIIHFGDVEYLTKASRVFGTNTVMTGIISSSVQLFYTRRVKVVTGNMWIVLFIVVCAIIDLLAAIGTSIAISILPVFADAVKFEAIIVIWWGLLTISALTLSNIMFINARFCRRCRCVHYNITHLPSAKTQNWHSGYR